MLIALQLDITGLNKKPHQPLGQSGGHNHNRHGFPGPHDNRSYAAGLERQGKPNYSRFPGPGL